ALKTAIENLPTDLDLLLTLHQRFVTHKLKPAGDSAKQLKEAMKSEDADVQAAAIHLAGIWGVKAFVEQIRELAETPETADHVRHRAFFAFLRLDRENGLKFLTKTAATDPNRLHRRFATEALTNAGLALASGFAAELLKDCGSEEEANAILAPFLSRRGGSDVLAGALMSVEISETAATWISTALSSAGRNEPGLTAVINQALGVQAGAPDYSAEFVQQLLTEVRESGDVENGLKVYESQLLNCIACHAIKGKGGVLGPDLTTVGAGLTPDLLIESVLWPNRQLKEGYFSVTVSTKDGRIYNGYREREEAGVLWLRDIATQKSVPIQTKDIAKRDDVGTLMPAGLTSSLSREDLRDLIRFLSELRG
ncbi:MAG: putative heme-binding domain-containing protein, partial [Verrucomicrobiales bacterium]